ncbi:MAG: hypothetical protein DMG30_00995 [Acidobacteria bacterium]|nr:MAG: hypothetical protein DMG30_00995 [Acidobacteriota bacterium]
MLPRTQPINPSRIAAAFDHPDWIFELKHDGFRAVAYIEGGACELVSRKQVTYKSFLDLMRRRRQHAAFYAFDLLFHDGEDLRGLPLTERKRRLRRLIRASRNERSFTPITSRAEAWISSEPSASVTAKASSPSTGSVPTRPGRQRGTKF